MTSPTSGMSGPAPYAPAPMGPPMMMPMETPDTGRIKTGLLLGGIGLLISAFIGFVGFGFVGSLITLIGVVLIFLGTKSYASARGMAGAGLGLVLIGFVLQIVAWTLLPTALGLFTSPTAAQLEAYLKAWATSLLVSFIGGLLLWVGVLLAPLKVVTGSSKGLVIAGGILGILAVLVVFSMVYLAANALIAAIGGGTVPTVEAIISIAFGIILGGLAGLIGGILAGVGYIIGRGKLVPAGAPPM